MRVHLASVLAVLSLPLVPISAPAATWTADCASCGDPAGCPDPPIVGPLDVALAAAQPGDVVAVEGTCLRTSVVRLDKPIVLTGSRRGAGIVRLDGDVIELSGASEPLAPEGATGAVIEGLTIRSGGFACIRNRTEVLNPIPLSVLEHQPDFITIRGNVLVSRDASGGGRTGLARCVRHITTDGPPFNDEGDRCDEHEHEDLGRPGDNDHAEHGLANGWRIEENDCDSQDVGIHVGGNDFVIARNRVRAEETGILGQSLSNCALPGISGIHPALNQLVVRDNDVVVEGAPDLVGRLSIGIVLEGACPPRLQTRVPEPCELPIDVVIAGNCVAVRDGGQETCLDPFETDPACPSGAASAKGFAIGYRTLLIEAQELAHNDILLGRAAGATDGPDIGVQVSRSSHIDAAHNRIAGAAFGVLATDGQEEHSHWTHNHFRRGDAAETDLFAVVDPGWPANESEYQKNLWCSSYETFPPEVAAGNRPVPGLCNIGVPTSCGFGSAAGAPAPGAARGDTVARDDAAASAAVGSTRGRERACDEDLP